MSELFEKSIRTLELPAVLEKLAAKAVSQAAKDRCLKLTPSTDAEEVLRLLDETDAAKERLGLHGSPSFSGVKDVSAALTRADHGGMLNTRELLNIAGVLTASGRPERSVIIPRAVDTSCTRRERISPWRTSMSGLTTCSQATRPSRKASASRIQPHSNAKRQLIKLACSS